MKYSLFLIIILLSFVSCSSSERRFDDDGTNRASASRSVVIMDDGTSRNYPKKISKSKEAKPVEESKVSIKQEPVIKKTPLEKESIKTTPKVYESDSQPKIEKTEPMIPKKDDEPVVKREPPKPKEEIVQKAGSFYYPIEKIAILHDYSEDNDHKNSGIDFSVSTKTSVKTASPGWVIFAGKKSGVDGNLVIVFHNEKYLTIFSNLDSISVKKGDYIKNYDTVVGSADSYFHFELRQQTDKGIKVLDPKSLLVKRK